MNESSISSRLCAVLGDVLGVDASSLTEQSSPDTVPQWDSLNHLMIVTAVENEFSISVSIDDAVAMTSVEAIRAQLASRGIRE